MSERNYRCVVYMYVKMEGTVDGRGRREGKRGEGNDEKG